MTTPAEFKQVMPTHTIKTGFILEDITETRLWISQLLSQVFPDISIVSASSCQEALAILKTAQPNIALIDLGLPDGSGIDIIRLLNTTLPDCHCIVSTVFDDDDHLFSALKAGASGYILKDQSSQEIEILLRGTLNNIPALSPAIARKLLDFFHSTTVTTATTKNPLTPKETEILLLIAKGYTVAKTAELSGITYSTAASYVKIIYRKLNISSRAEAALEASQLGLLHR